MSDGRLAALIGMLRLKSRIESSPADVWRAMQECSTISNPICMFILSIFALL